MENRKVADINTTSAHNPCREIIVYDPGWLPVAGQLPPALAEKFVPVRWCSYDGPLIASVTVSNAYDPDFLRIFQEVDKCRHDSINGPSSPSDE